MNPEHISYRFVPMGATAPDPLPPGEIWADVGNRVAPRVLDHHGGDTTAWCAAELVLNNLEEFILTPVQRFTGITIVTHQSPDLDAAASCWLIQKALSTGIHDHEKPFLARLVTLVGENDQGLVKTRNPEKSWPIVMRHLMSLLGKEPENEAVLEKIFLKLDQSLEILKNGGTFEAAAAAIITPEIRVSMARARQDYLDDYSKGTRFQVRLPVSDGPLLVKTVNESFPEIPYETASWILVDGLILNSPRSSLFREMARGDREHSPLGQGFPLLVVSYPLEDPSSPNPLYRHIISTDPLSGAHLQGLGTILEKLEKKAEEKYAIPLTPGRQRVPMGQGRHGTDVISPWYSGCGHGFTIVDSPSEEVNGKKRCASLLTPSEIREAVWDYGNPARMMGVQEAELALIWPVQLEDGWQTVWNTSLKLDALYPELALELKTENQIIEIRRKSDESTGGVPGLTMVDEQIWILQQQTALWVGRFRPDTAVVHLADLSSLLQRLRKSPPPELVQNSCTRICEELSHHIVLTRVNAEDYAMDDREGIHAQAAFSLATAEPMAFANRPDDDALKQTYRASSRDHKVMIMASRFGTVLISERAIPFKEEKDWHLPERFTALTTLTILQRASLQKLAQDLVTYRKSPHTPRKMFKNLIQCRENLFNLEHELLINLITDRGFGQRSYEALQQAIGIPRLLSETRRHVEAFAEKESENRSNFYQRLAFLVSVLLAPLVITTGFFSGTHLQKHFADLHFTFLPADIQPAGWLHFLIVFSVISLLIGVLWFFTKKRK